MTISFSGLASGLDTSSWVQSLVALKQAKVTTYSTQQTALYDSKNALNQIKSFFSTFRSMLERITDTRFGVGSMDLFSQNLANSSNANVLTASASADSVEGVYNIKVDRIATNSQATSGYKTTTTREETNIATKNTLLSDLGVNAGDFAVTVGGVEQTVTINDGDTIDDLVTKLKNYGVNAGYDESSGRFSMDIGSTEIRDVSGTNLVNAFHLQGINHGYQTGANITRTETETVYENATTSTKMSQLGLDANASMSIKVNGGAAETITVNKNDSIATVISNLAAKGVQATLEDGVFTIYNAEIVNADTNAVAQALGLSSTVTNQTQQSGNLSFDTTITTTTLADGTTKLSQLGITGTTFTYTSRTGSDTVTVSSTATIQDLIDGFAAKGVLAEIDENGNFEVHGVSALDSKLTAKLGTSTVYDTVANSNVLKYTTTVTTTTQAAGTTKMSEIGVTDGVLTCKTGSGTYNVTVNANDTISTFISNLNTKAGVVATISNGEFKIENSDVQFTNSTSNISTKFNLISPEVATASQVSNNLTYTTVVTTTSAATLDIQLNNLNEGTQVSNGDTIIFKNNSNQYRTITLTPTSTLYDLKTAIQNAGGSFTQRANGSLYLSGIEITGGTYDAVSSLRLNSVYSDGGNITYSGSALTYNTVTEETKNAMNDTSLLDLGITSGQYYIVENGVRKTAYISEGDTVADLREHLSNYGIQAALVTTASGSKLQFFAEGDSYIEAATGAGASNINTKLFGAATGATALNKTYNYEAQLDVVSSTTNTVNAASSEKVTDFGIAAGVYELYQNGEKKNFYISNSDTFADLKANLGIYGIQASLVEGNSGVYLSTTGNGNTYLNADFLPTKSATNTRSGVLSYTTTTTETIDPDNEALMSDFGVSSGQYYIYNNGVKYTANISTNETFGSFRDTLRSFGIQASFVQQNDGVHLVLNGTGDSYIAKSNAAAASNVVDTLFPTKVTEYNYSNLLQTSHTETTTITATTTDMIADYAGGGAQVAGKLNVEVDGVASVINLTANETFESLINKFDRLGVTASLSNSGTLTLQAGEKTISVTKPASEGSNILTKLGLTYSADLGGYTASSSSVTHTVEITEENTYSASNYADYGTTLSMLNISSGTLSLYRNGQKSTIQVNAGETFSQLRSRVNGAFTQGDVDIKFEDGYLKFYSTDSSVSVEVGSSVDTSNMSTLCGLVGDGQGGVTSSRELYKVNADSRITQTGLFRKGNITAGTFTVGNAQFTIDGNTTIRSLIGQINASDDANATAYWDSVDGKLVISSRSSGSSYINIEAGTSNFTDILGFTESEWNGDGSVKTTKLIGDSQKIGDSALFSINGTSFTSTSNIVGSDITRLNGVKLNLRNVSEGETITLSIERDTETLSNAISDIVDAYNELIENVDTEIAKTGSLSDQSGLKMIRNQIRSLMTSSLGGEMTFANLANVGITVDTASASNISTSTINKLSFNKDTFTSAYKSDTTALKRLLVGSEDSKGILSKVEDIVENALTSVSGYFASAESAYDKKIQKLTDKISKQNTYVSRYQARLENKFRSMESIITKIQQQYQSFLTS